MRHLILFALGVIAGRAVLHCGDRPPRRQPPSRIRVAGRAEMRDPPRQWSDTDERSDASFPASDPPGNY